MTQAPSPPSPDLSGLLAVCEGAEKFTWDPHYLSVEQADFADLASPATIKALILRLQQAEGEVERLSLEVTALQNTAPCLYPSKPGETRAGFSSNGVHVEGSQESIKAVASWNHIATQAPQWSCAIDDANQRATTAEAKCAELVESLERYGTHYAGCKGISIRRERCSCGFDAAILSAKGV